MSKARALLRRLMARPFVLLPLANLMWAGNAIAGRLAIDHVSPMALTSLRWVLVLVVLGPLLRERALAELGALRRGWPVILAMGGLGFTGFNALYYWAAHRTTAVNLSLIQGAMPAVVLLGSLLAFGTRIRAVQAAGVTLTLLGVAILAAKGELSTLRQLEINPGDLGMLAGSLFYAGYTLGLRACPPLPPLVLFLGFATAAFLTSLPLVAWEVAAGTFQAPDARGLALLLYIGAFPSLLAQVLFMRAVELIGPGRAGVFFNLVPVFGAVMAVGLLGEPFHAYHAVALALVLLGIGLAERRRPPAPA